MLLSLFLGVIGVHRFYTGHIGCPGCAITTAMMYFLQGKLELAYKTNHLIVIVAPILLWCWLDYIRKNF